MIISNFLIPKLLRSTEFQSGAAVWMRHRSSLTKKSPIQIGSKAELSKVFTQSDVNQFAQISLDNNELHLDENAAKKSGFEKQIVHGILVNGLVSAVLGTILPGKGSILVSQQIKFLNPVYVDRKITIKVQVVQVLEKLRKTFYECEFEGFVENPTETTLCVKGAVQLIKKD